MFYARTDPRYEITPVTPVGRKKFEGVVAGAWKPFVSLSLRRFVERGAVYHRRASGSSFLPSLFLSLSLEGTSNKSQPIVSRGTFYVRRLLTPFPSLPASPLLSNRPTIRNGFVREFTTYGMRFEARTLRGRSGGEEEEEDKRSERDARFSRNVRFRCRSYYDRKRSESR